MFAPIPLHKNALHTELVNSVYPKSMNLLLDWGTLLKQHIKDNIMTTIYSHENLHYFIRENKSNLYWLINHVVVFNQERILESKFIDIRQSMDDINTFIRQKENIIFHYVGGELLSRIEITDKTN